MRNALATKATEAPNRTTGDTMPATFAEAVLEMIAPGYNMQRGHEGFVHAATSKQAGKVEIVAVIAGGAVVQIKLRWDWPETVELRFVDAARNGMTPDQLRHMEVYNGMLASMLAKMKGKA